MREDKKLISQFDLQKHPEGGYFAETYRSEDKVRINDKERAASTTIYFSLNIV